MKLEVDTNEHSTEFLAHEPEGHFIRLSGQEIGVGQRRLFATHCPVAHKY